MTNSYILKLLTYAQLNGNDDFPKLFDSNI